MISEEWSSLSHSKFYLNILYTSTINLLNYEFHRRLDALNDLEIPDLEETEEARSLEKDLFFRNVFQSSLEERSKDAARITDYVEKSHDAMSWDELDDIVFEVTELYNEEYELMFDRMCRDIKYVDDETNIQLYNNNYYTWVHRWMDDKWHEHIRGKDLDYCIITHPFEEYLQANMLLLDYAKRKMKRKYYRMFIEVTTGDQSSPVRLVNSHPL